MVKLKKLKEICNFEKGNIGLAKAIPGDYPLVTTGASRKTCSSYQFDTKAVCIPLVSSTGHGHASLKNVHYQEGKFALGTILVALTAKDEKIINTQFLYLYLNELKDQILVPLMSGAANVTLSITKLQQLEIPLPDIEKQKGIVIKFNSIKQENEELKQEILSQQSFLSKLRQQILQEAIEGKLSAEWRNENPDVESASELLKRIRTEKEQLIKDKKIKKQKPLTPITEEEKPFEIPDTWEWIQLEELGSFYTGNSINKTIKQAKYTSIVLTDLPYIGTKDVGFEMKGINYQTGVAIPLNEAISLFKIAPKNSILICIEGGSSGKKIAITNKDICFGNKLLATVPYQEESSLFLYFLYNSNVFLNEFYNQSKGLRNGVSISIFKSIIVPYPPLKEQQAIVKRIKNLMSVLEEFEKEIKQNKTHSEQLMQAVLKEAFDNK